MSNCVEKITHDACGSKNLQVFQAEDGTYNGYCFGCGTNVKDPYKDRPPDYKPIIKKKSKEEIDAELAEINECGFHALPKRKLGVKALERFGIKVGLSEKDGVTPTIAYQPTTVDGVVTAYMCKPLNGGKPWTVGEGKGADLFGWAQAVEANAKRLYITEGQLDAAALFTIIKKQQTAQYKDSDPSIVSLPYGAGNADKVIGKWLGKIRKNFKEVALVFDQDEAGRLAVDKVLKIAPDFLVADLPCKDANECLIKGHIKGAFNAIMFKSSKAKNTKLVWGEDLHEAAKEQAVFGVSWPWPQVTELTRGIRTGETIYLGAAQKLGKSEVVNTLSAWLIKEHGWKVMVAKPEEANKKTYKLTAGKIVSKIFHDPKVEFDYEAYEKAGTILHGKLCMVNLYQHVGWETLKTDIVAAAQAGCKAVFIDPITNLTNGINAADANTKLQEIAQELSAMALDHDIVIFIFCHLRNPDSGLSHDRGGRVLTSQFAGSRAMGRSCNYMFGLEGNKDPDLSPEERNMRKLVLLDDREFGEVGEIDLYWDKRTTQFNEV